MHINFKKFIFEQCSLMEIAHDYAYPRGYFNSDNGHVSLSKIKSIMWSIRNFLEAASNIDGSDLIIENLKLKNEILELKLMLAERK